MLRQADRDDQEWPERCGYWAAQVTAPGSRPRQNREDRPTLILSGHGVRLYVDNGALVVQNGFTHHPQQREEWRFFSGDWRVPSRIVVLDGKGGLTFHALRWLAEHEIPLVHIDWRGSVAFVVGGGGCAVDPKLAQAQLASRVSGRWLPISRRLVSQKIGNSIDTLRWALPKSAAVEEATLKLKRFEQEMKRDPPTTVDDLRGVEGRAAIAYFAAWNSVPLNWKGTGRRPIPKDWRQIGRRASMVGDRKSRRNQYATHPVNAMLNYAYGILENQVRTQIVGAGLDPTIGYFHGNYRAKHALVYDLMEPLRPLVDRSVLDFVLKHTLSPADFVLTGEGVCRLNPQLARGVVSTVGDLPKVRQTVQSLTSCLS